ncbi:leucine-rich repeat receptor-like serine/threonine-protein kinase bam2 [Quercus suber]|uniref:Leucine-rich repeat receptor-like serine/threonine-protein kinase bam2 n=1 Tax=Quercus suber TaxID=58331 RepID=A0AAW0JHZ2_QUESU
MDVSNNKMSGKIPTWICNQTYSYGIFMENHYFEGQIPCETITVEFLDISHNLLDGSLPLWSSTQLRPLHLEENNFSGLIPEPFLNMLHSYKGGILTYMSVTYIMFFLGVIIVLYINPHWRLWCFNLAEDFIYSCYFCVANTLGRIPGIKAQFGTFDASNYEGNPFLCELPLEKNCTRRDDSSPTPMQSSDVSDEKWYKWPQDMVNVIIGNNTRLKFFALNNNLFTGPFHQWPKIRLLNLFKNAFQGYHPFSIGNMSLLGILNLSFNNFSTEVPKELLTGCRF